MFFFGKSDIGRKRSSNQDCFYTMRLAESVVLCVVCDGMGGANGGNIASDLAARRFVQVVEENIAPLLPGAPEAALAAAPTIEFSLNQGETQEQERVPDCQDAPALSLLRRAAEAANLAVFCRAKEEPSLAGMGTTLVATLIIGDRLYAVNVGDSRLYLLSRAGMQQLSHDHSYVQYLIDTGRLSPEEAELSPHKNIITRAIGIAEQVETDTFCVDLGQEDSVCYFLLCSDGLTNYLSEKDIFAVVCGDNNDTVPQSPVTVVTNECDETFCAIVGELEGKAETLVARANDNGGGDNITLVLLKYLPNCVEKTLPTDEFARMRVTSCCLPDDAGSLCSEGKVADCAPAEELLPMDFPDLSDAIAEQADRGQSMQPSYEITVEDFPGYKKQG